MSPEETELPKPSLKDSPFIVYLDEESRPAMYSPRSERFADVTVALVGILMLALKSEPAVANVTFFAELPSEKAVSVMGHDPQSATQVEQVSPVPHTWFPQHSVLVQSGSLVQFAP